MRIRLGNGQPGFEIEAGGETRSNVDTYCARFRGVPRSVREARQAVGDYACLCGFSSHELADITSAVGEALANAVEHGTRDLGHFTVSCVYDGRGLTIEIADQGPGFDFAGPRRRDPLSVRGFGITMMHALMDRVTFADRGNVVRLFKRGPRCVGASENEETAEG